MLVLFVLLRVDSCFPSHRSVMFTAFSLTQSVNLSLFTLSSIPVSPSCRLALSSCFSCFRLSCLYPPSSPLLPSPFHAVPSWPFLILCIYQHVFPSLPSVRLILKLRTISCISFHACLVADPPPRLVPFLSFPFFLSLCVVASSISFVFRRHVRTCSLCCLCVLFPHSEQRHAFVFTSILFVSFRSPVIPFLLFFCLVFFRPFLLSCQHVFCPVSHLFFSFI